MEPPGLVLVEDCNFFREPAEQRAITKNSNTSPRAIATGEPV
jgi:hypothetical protein